jgi:predicted DCC family thiol-disulfide oxidoreductase YuxK
MCKNFSLRRNNKLNFFDIKNKNSLKILKQNNLEKNLKTIFYVTDKKVYKESEAVAEIFKTFF